MVMPRHAETRPKLVEHHLVVDLKVKLAKKKLQKMHPKVTLLGKEELSKILEEKVIHLVNYLE